MAMAKRTAYCQHQLVTCPQRSQLIRFEANLMSMMCGQIVLLIQQVNEKLEQKGSVGLRQRQCCSLDTVQLFNYAESVDATIKVSPY